MHHGIRSLCPMFDKLSFLGPGILARGLWTVLLLTTIPVTDLSAADWPQILGPNRDGQVPDVPRLKGDWTELEPKWTKPLGSGYGGPAIVGDTVLVCHRQADKELLLALHLADGTQRWQTSWSASYRPGINPDNGPRCVPAAAEDVVVCYGAAGDLACVRLTDGRLLWNRPLREEYGAEDGYFGAGSSPIIVDGLAIVCVGGRSGGIVAVELTSGKTRWTCTDYEASYASPVLISNGEQRQVLAVTRLNVVLLNAVDGTLVGDLRFGSRGPTVNAATPIQIGDSRWLLTASYGVGALAVDVQPGQLSEGYRSKKLLSSQYNTPVYVADRLIGTDGREDVGLASLKAVDPHSQSVIWQRPSFGTAHVLAFNDRVLCLGLEGRLTLLEAMSNSYTEVTAARLPSGTYRALPAMSGNQLLIRASQSADRSQLHLVELR